MTEHARAQPRLDRRVGPTSATERGDLDCVLSAWRECEAELRGYLLHRLGDPHAADDILQDTFLKSIRSGRNFCEVTNSRAWLFQVARNTLVDRARLAKPQEEVTEHLVAPEQPGRDPVDELDACVARNLAEMTADDRAVIEACDLAGRSQQVFAEANGLTLPAVKSRLLRARQRLREALVRSCQVRFDDAGRVCCHVPRPAASAGDSGTR